MAVTRRHRNRNEHIRETVKVVEVWALDDQRWGGARGKRSHGDGI